MCLTCRYRYAKGEVLMKENNDKKLEELKAKFEDNPEDFEIVKKLADMYLELNRPEDAIVYLSKALELNPDHPQAYNQIGICYLAQDKFDEAEKNLIKALKLDFNLVESHFNLATLYQRKGQYQQALSHFKEVVLENPEDYVVYHRMGKCAAADSMHEEAEEFFKETIRLKPDLLEASSDLATLYINQERLSDAEDILANILKYHPEVAGLHLSLGLVLKEQEKYLDAIAHLREVVIHDENNAEAFNHLGECCVAADTDGTGTGMNEQAVPFFAKAIKLEPEYYQAIFNLGKLYSELEQNDKAIMTLEQCLQVLNGLTERKEKWGEEIEDEEIIYTPVYNLLGKAYMQDDRKEKARESWEKSLEIKPDQPEIQKALDKIPKPLHERVSLTID